MSVGLLLVAAFLVTGALAARRGDTPAPLRGGPLVGRTGLTFLVAARQPFLFDADTGAVTRIRGIARGPRPVVWVTAIGDHAVISVDRNGRGRPAADLYLVRRGSSTARRFATGWEVARAAGGGSFWVKSVAGGGRCLLRRFSLTGRALGGRRVPCSARLVDAGTRPVLFEGSSVVDPATKATLFRGGPAWAITGRYALTAGESGRPLTVTTLGIGARRQMHWSGLAGVDGTDQAVVSRDGRRIAVDFATPSFEGSGIQVTDAWLVDPVTATMEHLPGMPAQVDLKFTSMAWAADGRLVWLASTGGRAIVAVWRPGAKQLAVRHVQLPVLDGGSDNFVVWTR